VAVFQRKEEGCHFVILPLCMVERVLTPLGGADSVGVEICGSRISMADAVVWSRKCGCERHGHAEVGSSLRLSTADANELQFGRPLDIPKHGRRLHLQFGALRLPFLNSLVYPT